jgi:hypothetical protein
LQRKTVTYPEVRFLKPIDRFLINSLQATPFVAFSGRQTPYPQKHQQRSGVTLCLLWKSPEDCEISGSMGNSSSQKRELISY